MNWTWLRPFPWLDTRARFVAGTPASGALLDLGPADGETLRHIAELRPDLRFFAADVAGEPDRYPSGCQFQRADLERDSLRWEANSMDAITCMHLIEHLEDLSVLLRESARVLKPGGRIYFETPHSKTVSLRSPSGKAAGTFTLNFYDDPTHIRPVAMDMLAEKVRQAGLEVVSSGISRNWFFAASYALLWCLPDSRHKFTAKTHWIGWSAYLIARRPA